MTDMAQSRLETCAKECVRGTCVAIEGSGILLRGRSGSGKSDLALRLIDAGARLVADDYTVVVAEQRGLIATAPNELRGLLEVRGVGIVRVQPIASAMLVAAIDIISADDVERAPSSAAIRILGATIPCFRLAAWEASAVAKVRLVAGIVTGAILRLE